GPKQDNFLAVSEAIPGHEEFTTKEHATELRVRVLEGKIQMTGALRANIAQLTGNPNLTELLFQERAHVRRQLGDRQDTPGSRLRKQFAELPLRFSFFAHGSAAERPICTTRRPAGSSLPCRCRCRFR